MSANNYLEIRREGKEYVVSDLCADTDKGTEIARKKSLKDAIKWAEDYQNDLDHIVEYGIRFSNT